MKYLQNQPREPGSGSNSGTNHSTECTAGGSAAQLTFRN